MRIWTNNLTLAVMAAALTLAACTEDGPAEADAPRPYLTDVEFADSLAVGRMPNIDWIGWSIKGHPLDRFPLELRTEDEILAEQRERGMRLPSGNYMSPGALRTYASIGELNRAQDLIVRALQPSGCPFVPCRTPPHWEAEYQEVAERLGLPYRPVDEVVQWNGVEFTPAQYEEARERRRQLKGGIR